MTASHPSWDVTLSRPRAHEQRQTIVDLEALQASRVARLGGALEALARDLAQARRELKQLRKETPTFGVAGTSVRTEPPSLGEGRCGTEKTTLWQW